MSEDRAYSSMLSSWKTTTKLAAAPTMMTTSRAPRTPSLCRRGACDATHPRAARSCPRLPEPLARVRSLGDDSRMRWLALAAAVTIAAGALACGRGDVAAPGSPTPLQPDAAASPTQATATAPSTAATASAVEASPRVYFIHTEW